jgi:hypothetical protein
MKKTLTLFTLLVLFHSKLLSIDFSQRPTKIPAYYIAQKQNLAVVKRNLLHQRFDILAITSILPGYTVITITNKELQNTNSYMATLQVNIGPHEIRVQNPSYLGAAYLNQNYYYGKFCRTVNALEKALGTLVKDEQQLNISELPNYKFMYGLPKKEDMLSVKKLPHLTKLFLGADTKEYIAYRLLLPNGSVLVGHKLHQNTNDFLRVLKQEKNTQMLPYESMINGNEASIMNPKYYLALSLPTLTLHEFMQIASTPDKIYRNIKKAYDDSL